MRIRGTRIILMLPIRARTGADFRKFFMPISVFTRTYLLRDGRQAYFSLMTKVR